MTKFISASFGVIALVASTFVVPAGYRHSQPVKSASTAEIPSPNCPFSDPNGCGIYE